MAVHKGIEPLPSDRQSDILNHYTNEPLVRVIGFEPMTSPFQAEPSTKLSLHPDNWKYQRELNLYCKDENLVSLPLDDGAIFCS